jgi:hypothetical protein
VCRWQVFCVFFLLCFLRFFWCFFLPCAFGARQHNARICEKFLAQKWRDTKNEYNMWDHGFSQSGQVFSLSLSLSLSLYIYIYYTHTHTQEGEREKERERERERERESTVCGSTASASPDRSSPSPPPPPYLPACLPLPIPSSIYQRFIFFLK